MPEQNSSHDNIADITEMKSQALKYLPHWPPVNIEFEDIVYTVPDELESKYGRELKNVLFANNIKMSISDDNSI